MENNDVQLLRLKIGNFRSFGRVQEISFSDDGLNTRRITSIIGLNATGKSNIFKAIEKLQLMIRLSASAGYMLPFDCFKFTEGYDEEPTQFELQFRSEDSVFTYGIHYNATRILFEVLKEKHRDTRRQRVIFERNGQDLNPGAANFGFSRTLMEKTRPNTLLITKAIENNNAYANIVYGLINKIHVVSSSNGQLEGMAIKLLGDNPELLNETISALKNADFSIQDIRLNNVRVPSGVLEKLLIPDELKNAMRVTPGVMVNMSHALKDDFGKPILNDGIPVYRHVGIENESIGTRSFLGIIVPIIDSIKKNKILLIDEFGVYLHYGLVQRIVNTYIRQKNAPGLIVCTHAGMMLECVERDSIYVLTKDTLTEESQIHRMAESGARLNENYGRGYYQGRYGKFLSYSDGCLF